MKNLKILLLLTITTIFLSAGCNKEPQAPDPNSFYFRCYIDGRYYIPNNCANCMSAKLLKDTTLILRGNSGLETVGIGINDNKTINTTIYNLNEVVGRQGDYKNSTIYDDRFFTDVLRTGQLKITLLDKTKHIIEGSFFFKAYNGYRDDSVSITNGVFRIKYTTK